MKKIMTMLLAMVLISFALGVTFGKQTTQTLPSTGMPDKAYRPEAETTVVPMENDKESEESMVYFDKMYRPNYGGHVQTPSIP